MIRPANAAYCGSAFGDGIYSAPSPNKSYNYTRYDSQRNSRWMFVNAVITGNTFDCTNNYDRIGNIRICDLDGNQPGACGHRDPGLECRKGSRVLYRDPAAGGGGRQSI